MSILAEVSCRRTGESTKKTLDEIVIRRNRSLTQWSFDEAVLDEMSCSRHPVVQTTLSVGKIANTTRL